MKCNQCHQELEYIFQELWFCRSCKECLGHSEALAVKDAQNDMVVAEIKSHIAPTSLKSFAKENSLR